MAQKIDVEKIMDEIRADIERRELDDTLVPFDEIPFSNEIMNVLPDSHAYSRKELNRAKSWRTPIREQLNRAEEQARKQPQRELEKEAVHGDR